MTLKNTRTSYCTNSEEFQAFCGTHSSTNTCTLKKPTLSHAHTNIAYGMEHVNTNTHTHTNNKQTDKQK
eukprot:m.11651 g.11651  ORF g.11651 m.11651 type:complete len:69 (-) comp5754_c1_seq1:322-528(-)